MFSKFVMAQLLRRGTRGKFAKPAKMQALVRLPSLLRLGYALIRDPRVPMWQRASALSLLGLILSPIDVVSNVPVVGQFWDVSLAVVVLDLFIQYAPPAVVNEHIVALGLAKKVPLRDV